MQYSYGVPVMPEIPETEPTAEKFKPYEERPIEELTGGHADGDWDEAEDFYGDLQAGNPAA
jgi:hypothetical protein